MTRRWWNDERLAVFLAGPVSWAMVPILFLIVVIVTFTYMDISVSVAPRAEELAIGDSTQAGGQVAGAEQTVGPGVGGEAGGGVSGASVFASNCAACHGGSGEGGIGPALAGQVIPRSEITTIVGSGRGAMPSFDVTLSPDELAAVVDYVVGLGAGTAGEGATGSTTTETTVGGEAGGGVSGASVFASNCAACHGGSGEGGIGPALAGQVIPRSEITTIVGSGRGAMPSFDVTLSPDELAAVVDYVVGLGAGTAGGGATDPAPPPTQSPGSGGTFGLFCASCHGPDGRGTELGRDLSRPRGQSLRRCSLRRGRNAGLPRGGHQRRPTRRDHRLREVDQGERLRPPHGPEHEAPELDNRREADTRRRPKRARRPVDGSGVVA